MISKCRLCLNSDISCDELLSLDHNISIKEKLQSCVPEIDIGLLQNSLICTTCSIALNSAFDFKCRCIESEKHIRASLETILGSAVIVKQEASFPTNTTEVNGNCSIYIKHEDGQESRNKEFLKPLPLAGNSASPCHSQCDYLIPSDSLTIDEVDIKPDITDQSLNVSETDTPLSNPDVTNETGLTLEYYEEDDVKLNPPGETQSGVSSLPDCSVTLSRCDEKELQADGHNNNVFTCDVCLKKFFHRRYLQQHYRLHTDPFVCNLCNAKFAYKSHLNNHIFAHTGETPFCCEFCGAKFSRRGNLDRHQLIHSMKSSIKHYSCKSCNCTFTNKSDITRHSVIHKGEQASPCTLCKPNIPPSSDQIQTNVDTKLFLCHFCDYKSDDVDYLKKHILSHCDVNVKPKDFSCKLCNYKTFQKRRLIKHMRSHAGVKYYSCKLCNSKFTKQSSVTQHMWTHSEKPFSCSVCTYKSATQHHLIEHERTHTGERPFVCEFCNYKAARKSHLKRHLLLHAVEKTTGEPSCS